MSFLAAKRNLPASGGTSVYLNQLRPLSQEISTSTRMACVSDVVPCVTENGISISRFPVANAGGNFRSLAG